MSSLTTPLSNGAATATLVDLIEHHIRFSAAKRQAEMSRHDWYRVTALVVRDLLVERMLATRTRFERSGAKKLYYLSLEFLIGRSLENNLFNLGVIEVCREFLAENGIDLQPLFEEEPDAALGNGGLGRLAACFLDSLATLDMPGYAYGINYEFGLFRQEIRDGYQVERPDSWQRETSPWLVARPEEACVDSGVWSNRDRREPQRRVPIAVGGPAALVGIPSDLPISGYGSRTVNFVRLYLGRRLGRIRHADLQRRRLHQGGRAEDGLRRPSRRCSIRRTRCAAGRELRLLQEYFFVACAVRDIVAAFLRTRRGSS